ncbi:GtrA family protein [Pseudoxanthomonas taiwanensis]|uniref:GtrA/DPMS transmembrane domain-containing protein n=1 Tax=Pseudoxanthomonas taiwanensis TaxID=176598 RepID=A0A921P0K1_9GAMM|nr:GtrA family protein [Pseudoxanthomonas taiwanensis]KAF1689394.1 hypothetical protein CR938_06160 [Pseudoxanthomonas taiwanensis]
MRSFLLFGVAGGIAFLVDAGVLHVLVSVLGADPYLARLVSFLCAVTTTWVFNRSITFSASARGIPLWQEWGRYLASQLGGFSVNYLVYAVLVATLAGVRQWPVIGVAAGSLAGLLVNYLLARRYVFRRS